MSKAKLIAVCFLWLIIIGAGAMTYRWLVKPAQQVRQAKVVEEQKHKVLVETGANSRYDYQLRMSLDSFSGYAVARSEEFASALADKRIKVDLVDDGADYSARLKSLRDGETQMAMFTADALITTSAEMGEMPGTIVAIVDETRGADAMVAFKDAVPNVDALDNADTKFVLTPKSPSETLSRVVMARFNLRKLGKTPFIEVKDAEEVYKRYRTAKPNESQVFVLWEPFVSKVLENPNMHVVIDSSRFRGYIIDVIVANRNFLYQNRNVVADVVESYFRANYAYRDKYIELVTQDAQKQGQPLSSKQAENLVKGIWWKNCQENYAHFGLHENGKLQHIEDILTSITKVLVATGGIQADPTNGSPNALYFPGILEQLKQKAFHPGIENVRNDIVILPELTENQWEGLLPVGTLEVPPLVFARGTSVLTDASQQVLNDIVATLNNFPQYYIVLKGNASKDGDIDANKALAQARAKAAETYLVQHGINERRVRAVGVEPSGETRVDFILGQTPY